MGSLWYQDDLTEGLKLVLKAEADFRKVVELVESEGEGYPIEMLYNVLIS